MAQSFFSIIVPSFNSGGKIEPTIDSVLAQDDVSYELLIIDGGSNEETLSIIRRYAQMRPDIIRWVSEPDKGVYDAMNKGINLAAGKYLYFLGAGDTLRPGVLGKVADAAPKEGVAFIYGGIHWVERNRDYIGPCPKEQLAVYTPSHQAIFYERSIFDLVGGYDLRYCVNADWAVNIKCFGDTRIQKVYIDLVIADYEGGGISATRFDKEFARDRPRLVAENLGIETTGYLFYAAEQKLAMRIDRATSALARKFWHAQLWLLHNTIRPLFYGRIHKKASQG